MTDQLIGVTDSSDNQFASEALIRADRIVFIQPTEADRCRSRWARADVLLAAESDHLVSRRDGVAVVSIDPSTYGEAFDFIPDPVVLVIAPAETPMPNDRCVLVPRYAGCCYSIRVTDGSATVTELSRPPEPEPHPGRETERDRRRARRRRAREPETPSQPAPEAEADSPESEAG